MLQSPPARTNLPVRAGGFVTLAPILIECGAGAAQMFLTEYPEFIHRYFLSNSQQSIETISGKSLIVVIKLNN
jgi:hypothetical protein